MYSNRQACWLTQYEAARERLLAGGGKPAIASAEQIGGMTGLQILHAMMAGELPYPPMNDTMNMTLVEADSGWVVFMGIPEPRHCNPFGTVHGGWFSTLLDSALGCSIQSALPEGRTYTTVELSVNIVRPATPSSGPLRAAATLIHSGRQIATAQARVEDENGKLYAHATTTCMVFDRRA
ncbi:PaaI family thioesterase [Achromobacter sp. MFA1 R4]|uniref:PaaI family thioesterase n=1 Tax=Achromobacter sp. MFA1 R4 TaxID=1881016 RepID=UPI00095378B3|nr:PaaI family thioesterase [Achromobacter sp. MFA1 R4]SIT30377.1 uncharacterized domain 1-containing protein [Achromobacter sp. MFA1 R4]